jgi:hypothetical protein
MWHGRTASGHATVPKANTVPTSRHCATPATSNRAKTKTGLTGSNPVLRFYHSQEMRARTLEGLEIVETANEAAVHSARLTQWVLALTDHGRDQYFLQPLKPTKANFVVLQSAPLGLSGVQKVVRPAIRNMCGRMDDRQLHSVCGSIREFMARDTAIRHHATREGLRQVRIRRHQHHIQEGAHGNPPIARPAR